MSAKFYVTDVPKYSWIASSPSLGFPTYWYCLKRLTFRGFALDVPITKLTKNVDDAMPPWQIFSTGVEVTTVRQPIEFDLPRITLLPYVIRYVTGFEDSYLVDLHGSFADYMKKFSAKPRHNLLRSVRKFREQCGGQISMGEFCSPEDMVEFQRLAIEISQRSYKKGTPIGFPESEDFHKDTLDRAARGTVRGYVLFCFQRPVAFIFCLVQHENLVYSHIGYDPEFRAWSPGTVLLYCFLEKLFEQNRFRFVELGGGKHPYKSLFSTDSIRCASIMYFRRTWRNFVIVIAHYSVSMVWKQVARLLQVLQLKPLLKRLIRPFLCPP